MRKFLLLVFCTISFQVLAADKSAEEWQATTLSDATILLLFYGSQEFIDDGGFYKKTPSIVLNICLEPVQARYEPLPVVRGRSAKTGVYME